MNASKPRLANSGLVLSAAERHEPLWAVFTIRDPHPPTLETYRTEQIANGVRRKREEQGYTASVWHYTAEEVCAAAASRGMI